MRATAGLLAAALLLIVGAGIYFAPRLAGGEPGLEDRAFAAAQYGPSCSANTRGSLPQTLK